MAPKSLQETITHIRSRTDQLANFVYSPDAREILAQGDLHPARAMVIRAILATPRLPKFLHEHTQGSAYRRAGFDILGIGYHAITVDDGPSTVRKFYRHTAAMSEGAQKSKLTYGVRNNRTRSNTLRNMPSRRVSQLKQTRSIPVRVL